jgi:spermidine synthase
VLDDARVEIVHDDARHFVLTFLEAFPGASAWTNHAASTADPGTKLGYDVVLLGTTGGVPAFGAALPPSAVLQRLVRPDHYLVRASLDDVELTRPSPAVLFDHYIARLSQLAPWLKGAQINRDRNLRLQYLAGMGLDARNEAALLDNLLAYRR